MIAKQEEEEEVEEKKEEWCCDKIGQDGYFFPYYLPILPSHSTQKQISSLCHIWSQTIKV